jgi:hypothetical protein
VGAGRLGEQFGGARQPPPLTAVGAGGAVDDGGPAPARSMADALAARPASL